MEVVAIVNRKGGVGKTATAQALGAGLLKKKKKVLYIDLDSQTNLSYGLGADPEGLNSMDVLTGEATAEEAIQHTKQGDVIAGSEALAGADAAIDGTGKEYRLKEAIDSLQYDYIIIDTPAQLGTLTVNALTASDSVLIPIQCEFFPLEGLTQLMNTIRLIIHHLNPELKIEGVVLTMKDNRSNLVAQVSEEVKKFFNTKVYDTYIPRNVRLAEAPSHGLPIVLYDTSSKGANAYLSLAEEILNRNKLSYEKITKNSKIRVRSK